MSCWSILGIEPNSDKKAIKTAYARLLKNSRPDENPEGFKQLHDAYQHALKQLAFRIESSIKTGAQIDKNDIEIEEIVKRQSTEIIDIKPTSSESIETVSNNFLDESNQDTVSTENQVPAPVNDSLQQDWEMLFRQMNDLINSPSDRKLLQQWKFIDTIPSLFDLEFKSNVSDKLFILVAQANLDNTEQDGELAIPTAVLNYLCELFNWEEKWIHYERQFDPNLLDAVYPYITYTPKKKVIHVFEAHRLYSFRRVFAFFIDIVIGFFLIKFFFDAFGVKSDMVIVGSIFQYFLVSIPLLEASHWQASFGKKIMGLKVINKHGMRLGLVHSFWRSFVTLLFIVGIKITVWISLFTAYKYQMLYQDISSRSYVVRKNNEAD